jgi:outer membrane receptor protein involved in Fe transport
MPLIFIAAASLARAQTPAKPVVMEQVTVTADRGLVGVDDSAASVATLTRQQMQQVPGLALDDQLHQVAGFQLFRRTSSWTANPTSQGLSLRGLGSTAASRTLVVSDEVPLNDPFGGWIHWNEVPSLAIRQVELLRGGAADLYGSSAIGGVVEIVPATANDAHKLHFAADAAGAAENTSLEDELLTTETKAGTLLEAFSGLKTGGYVATAPALRGLVDVPSNVASQSGRVELQTPAAMQHTSAFLLGNMLNESRSNGTPLQTNATRLWRYVGGLNATADNTYATLRLFGSRESYRQGFSSIAANRNSETLTKLQRVPTDELGFVAQASRTVPHSVTAAAGVDLRDIRATDDETSVATSAVTSTAARQRETGGFLDAIWIPRSWSLSASVRVDSFRTFAAKQTASNSAAVTNLPEIDELVASPRIGVVFRPQARRLPKGLALTGNAFRAFRGPTMNELYRTGQVGSQTTLANASLLSERATGFESGAELDRSFGHLRAVYFWTEVNRPVSAVLLTQTATSQTLQRQNLGQIRSRGLMLEAQTRTWRGLDATVGYQLAVATVTAFNSSSPAQSNLTGNWIPQVPREALTATTNYANPRLISLHIVASYTGAQFDDAQNQFLLHPFARFDAETERSLGRGVSIFAGAQNLLNRAIDAGRTPNLTLAAPRLAEGGVRYRFGR